MIKTKDIPRDSDSITPEWLTAALRSSGTIGEANVHSITSIRIGEDESFTGGALLLLEIGYDAVEQGAPTSLVAKMASPDPDMRLLMKNANGREALFYTKFAAQDNLPIPGCYYSDFNAETGAFILLLEDLSHFQAVGYIDGCGPNDVISVVRALAKFHSYWWGSPQLEDMGGTSILAEFPFNELWAQYPQKVSELLPDIIIPETFIAMGQYIAANELSIFNRLMETGPITCIHRDISVDNILFNRQSESIPAILLDWQIVGKGRGAYDVAFFLIGSVPSEQRRETERNLLQIYHSDLLQYGVKDYSFDQCWLDYRLAAIGKLFITVTATVLMDNSTPHKRDWRKADLQRLLAFCQDHSVGELVSSIENERA
jgi:thiamine kinase-like enzyme